MVKLNVGRDSEASSPGTANQKKRVERSLPENLEWWSPFVVLLAPRPTKAELFGLN